MKRTISVIIGIMLIILLIPAGSSAEKAPENFAVVISENAPETDKFAADSLALYAGKIINREIPVITSAPAAADHVFYVGGNDSISSLADGTYVIEPVEGGTAIFGAGNRGTIYGVFGYLYDYCGYRCFASKTGMTSNADEIGIPDKKSEYNPYFEYTETDWISPRDDTYSVMNGLNGNSYRSLPEEKGGTVGYISGFCHTLTTQFCSADTYFDEHPEYFALHDGKRCRNQLCLTNPDVLGIVTDEVFNLLKEKHDPSASLQIVSLTQNDNRDYCECEKCKALDEENGSHQGTNLTFVNAVADAVKQAGYDNVAIDTFAYQYTRSAPSKVIPKDNVIIRLCTIECCFVHPLDDETCEENTALMKDLSDWGKICSRVYIWDYTTNYAYTCGIFPDFDVIQENIRTFYENGCKGVYEEGAYYVPECDTEFPELRAYMISRFLRDPYCDKDAVINDFLEGYYGNGWKNIREFIDACCANAAKKHSGIYARPTDVFSFTEKETAGLDELWAKAKSECTDEAQLANINRSEISWRFIKCSLGIGEYKGSLAGKEARTSLLNDIQNAGVVRWNEGGGMNVPANYMYMPIENWNGNTNGRLSRSLYTASKIIIGLAALTALVIFILAIKDKKYKLIPLFPAIAAIAGMWFWSRELFLKWENLGMYSFSLILIGICILVCGFVLFSKKKKTTNIIASFIFTFVFFVIYETPLLIINTILYKGLANDLAMAVSTIFSAVLLFAVSVIKLINYKKS